MMNDRRIANLESELQRIRAQLSEIPVRFPSPGSKGVGSEIQQFVFKSQQANWITCRSWDGLAEGANDVLVTKPWDLRPYVFSGKTYVPSGAPALTRVLYSYPTNDRRELITQRQIGGVYTEQSRATESVYPPWDLRTIGADRGLIYAFKPVGGTSEEDGASNAIVWQDANVSARTWRGAASALGAIVGTASSLQNDTITIGTTAGSVVVAKHHLHRLSLTSEGRGSALINFTLPNASNSSRRATRFQDNIFQNEQMIPRCLSVDSNEVEVGDKIIALDVGETVTGIPGVKYLDMTPRIWGRMP